MGEGRECVVYHLSAQIKREALRHHVGGHVLARADLQARDLCGFCGRNGLCRSSISTPVTKKGTKKDLLSCRYALRADTSEEEDRERVDEERTMRQFAHAVQALRTLHLDVRQVGWGGRGGSRIITPTCPFFRAATKLPRPSSRNTPYSRTKRTWFSVSSDRPAGTRAGSGVGQESSGKEGWTPQTPDSVSGGSEPIRRPTRNTRNL